MSIIGEPLGSLSFCPYVNNCPLELGFILHRKITMSEIEVTPIPNVPEKVWPAVATLKGQLHHLSEMFILEPNDGITRQHAENLLKTWLSQQHKHKQISDYAVSCDIFTNTTEVGSHPCIPSSSLYPLFL